MKSTIVILLALLAAAAAAQTGPEGASHRTGDGAGRGNQRGMRMHDRLGLDSATSARIAAMRDDTEKERIELRAKLRSARVDFRAAMRKNPADEKTAKSKQKEMAGYRERLEASALDHRLAVEKLLTPEQREIFRERGPHRRMNFDRGFDGHRRFEKMERRMRHPERHHGGGEDPEREGDGLEE